LTPGRKRSDLTEKLRGFRERVWDDEPAAWFRSRGLLHSTVERFGLGYTGTDRVSRSLDLRRCLVLPYEDGLGRVRQLRYRPLYSGAGAKYLSVGSDPSNLFAVRAADNPVVHLVEGEPDTMIAWQCGFKAVGVPGANNFKDEWRFLFRAPHVERVVLAFDPDNAGREAARHLYGLLRQVTDVDVVKLPEGKDLNDCYLEYGEAMVKEALS
jgi:DNA primase